MENFGNSSKVTFRCFYDFLKHSENLRKSSEIFGKLGKRFKSNFQMFLGFFKIFGKYSEKFGSVRKSSEILENGSKVIFRCFYDFLKLNFRKIFGNLRKSSETIGKFPNVIGNIRNGSQELKSFGAGF